MIFNRVFRGDGFRIIQIAMSMAFCSIIYNRDLEWIIDKRGRKCKYDVCSDPILCRVVPLQNHFWVSIPTIKRHFRTLHRFQEEDYMEARE